MDNLLSFAADIAILIMFAGAAYGKAKSYIVSKITPKLD